VQRVSRVASAQPKELAYTGADVSVPLTLGLLALGMGGALTVAGRRRESTTV
jgi:LPXTG-motif cell wall-anchored protein